MKKNILIVVFICCCSFGMAQDFSTDSVPVRLQYLQVSSINNTNKIQWSVVCLLDFASFDIQRSTDGVRYSSIKKFQADKLRCKSPFEFEDKTAPGRIYYRINVGDQDERTYTSKTLLVYGKELGFDVTAVSPTLVSNYAILSVSSASNDQIEALVLNQNGYLVARKKYSIISGSNDLRLDASTFSPGNYFVTFISKSGERKTARFIKQ
jgi:hypothetical protein